MLRFIGEQLLCAIKEDEPVDVDIGGGFGALESDEVWVHTDAAHTVRQSGAGIVQARTGRAPSGIVRRRVALGLLRVSYPLGCP